MIEVSKVIIGTKSVQVVVDSTVIETETVATLIESIKKSIPSIEELLAKTSTMKTTLVTASYALNPLIGDTESTIITAFEEVTLTTVKGEEYPYSYLILADEDTELFLAKIVLQPAFDIPYPKGGIGATVDVENKESEWYSEVCIVAIFNYAEDASITQVHLTTVKDLNEPEWDVFGDE